MKHNKIITFMLVICMIFTLIPTNIVEAKTSKKVKLSNSSITLIEGQSKTISLKNYKKLSLWYFII